MPAILLLKLFLVPFLIYAVTLAGRRWGPAVAGWMSAFPIVSGPILLTVTLEQGAGFAARAAEGTLLAVLAILVFTIAYAWAARRAGMAPSMLCALLAWAVAVAGLHAVKLPATASFVLVALALLVTPRLFPPNSPPASMPAPVSGPAAQGDAAVAPPLSSDLPWRMLAGAMLVLAVSYGAAAMGARLSGFFAMFPVMSTVLVGFSHVRCGSAFAVALLRGMVYGYFAFATFCLVLSLQLREGAVGIAFAAAFCCALAVQLAVRRLVAPATQPKPAAAR